MAQNKVDYKGIEIVQNSLTGDWFLFFRKDSVYNSYPPFVGTLAEMKKIINYAIKKGEGKEKEFNPSGTHI